MTSVIATAAMLTNTTKVMVSMMTILTSAAICDGFEPALVNHTDEKPMLVIVCFIGYIRAPGSGTFSFPSVAARIAHRFNHNASLRTSTSCC